MRTPKEQIDLIQTMFDDINPASLQTFHMSQLIKYESIKAQIEQYEDSMANFIIELENED